MIFSGQFLLLKQSAQKWNFKMYCLTFLWPDTMMRLTTCSQLATSWGDNAIDIWTRLVPLLITMLPSTELCTIQFWGISGISRQTASFKHKIKMWGISGQVEGRSSAGQPLRWMLALLSFSPINVFSRAVKLTC